MSIIRRYPLLLILFLALGLRLLYLGERNLWYDEAFSVLFARSGLSAMFQATIGTETGGAGEVHPLLYYVLLHGWMAVFGASAFAVRLWSVVLGVATVGVMALLGRDLFSRRTGYAAALVTALAPFHIQYSQETRMYALLGLLLALATWCFVRGSRPPAPVIVPGKARRWWAAWGWWVGFGMLAALAMYTQQLAAFYLVALGLVPILWRNPRQFRGAMLGAGIALILYLPWLVHLAAQWDTITSTYWIAVPPLIRILLTLRAFLTAAVDFSGSFALAALAGAVFLLLFLLIQAGMALRRPRHVDRTSLLMVLWLFAAPIALMWLVSQAVPVYLDRALLPSALMLYLALGWLFTRGGLPRPIMMTLATLGMVLSAASLMTHYTWNTFPNSPFREAAQWVGAEIEDGDMLVHQSKLSALPMLFYAPDLPQVFVDDLSGSPEDTLSEPARRVLGARAVECAAEAGQGAARLWFVVFPDVVNQARAAGRDDIAVGLDWLAAHYTEVKRQQFNDLAVILYAEPDEAARLASCAAQGEAA